MKNSKRNEQSKKQERNNKAAKLLRTLDEKQLETVAGGVCRTCGLLGSTPKIVVGI